MIRKVNILKENNIIYNLVEKAFAVELGNTGVAFRKEPIYGHLKPDDEEFLKELEHFYVYEESSKIIGCVKLVPDSDTVYIGRLSVHPDHQRQGIATKLLKFAETLATVKMLYVVSCAPDMIAFYIKRGFVEVHRMTFLEYVTTLVIKWTNTHVSILIVLSLKKKTRFEMLINSNTQLIFVSINFFIDSTRNSLC